MRTVSSRPAWATQRELMYYTTRTSRFIVNNTEHLGVHKLLDDVCMVTASDSDLFLSTYPVVKQCLRQLYVFIFSMKILYCFAISDSLNLIILQIIL